MAYTIISKPDPISLSGNIADFVIESSAAVSFVMSCFGETILNETHQPVNGIITIKLGKVIEPLLFAKIPTKDVFFQDKQHATVITYIDLETYVFEVIKGGVDSNHLNASAFLAGNWLTWQPQTKQVRLTDPEWLTFYMKDWAAKVKAKGYFLSKPEETVTLYENNPTDPSVHCLECYSFNMQYALISQKFSSTPSYIDVWIEQNGMRLSYVQRYVLSDEFYEFYDAFLFENGLGSIDSIRFTGNLQEVNDPESSAALFGDQSIEYSVLPKRIFNKNTGYFPSERVRVWAQDFFNSNNRYHVNQGNIQRIIVTKSEMKAIKGDLNAYSFQFSYEKQSKLLNLPRFDSLPEVIEIVDPNQELFFLAPRLSEFPNPEALNYQFLLPIQSPYEKKWFKVSISEIANLLTVEGGVGSHALDADKWYGHRWDDYMDQALKKSSDVEFHNAKINNLTAEDAVLKSLVSAIYQAGFNGKGFKIDAEGNAEVKSLMVRDQLTVLELVVQKLRSVGGMIVLSVANGTAEKVELKENSFYRVTLDTTGTRSNTFVIDDLVKCQRFDGGVKYYWRRVVGIGSNYIDIAKDGGDGSGIPEVGDEIVQLGHLTDQARQNAIIIDATALPKIDIYQGINSYSLEGKITSRLGDLTEFGMAGMGLFTSKGKFTGQVSITGGSGYNNLTDKPDLSVYSEKAYVDAIKNNLQSQIDGTITSWFFDYEPTLTNIPASNWGDAAVMEIHLGDLFYWTSKGYAYRFQKIGSVFSWARISDTDVTLALANAAKAQDTADGKRRVFTVQPTAPYDSGDLWAKGNAIYKCDVPKVAGQAFSASDWSVTATDDTAAIAAQTTATAAALAASAVFPSDANLVAHWSFDEVSDMPDGAAAYRSKQKWAAGIDGWYGNSGVTTSVENGMLKVVGTNNNGASFIRTWDEGFRGKSIVVKVRSAQTIANIRYYNGADIVEANAIVIDQYNWIARFENIQVNNFGGLFMYVNHGLINQTAWIEYIYVGDCSYSSILKDNSGRNHTANLYGVNSHLGLSGKALNFNGNGYVNLGSIGGQWVYSISFWFKKTSLPAVQYETLLGTTGGGAMEIEASTTGDGKINLDSWGQLKSQAYTLNEWHHVAIVQNSSNVFLYLDGVLVNSGTTRVQLPTGIQLGRWKTSQYFFGSIDEFRLYDKALMASEVLGLYKHITKGKAFAVDMEANYLKEALRNDTNVTGGLISTTLLKVGAVNKDGVYIERAGINGAGEGANTPRVYSGGTLAQAVERAAGTENGMAVITEEGEIFGSKGQIAGFSLTAQGFEREQAITEQDGTAFTGKFQLDWLSQAINFLRDGASKVRISSKKLISGIPSPTSATVSAGAWQNEVDVTETPSYTSPLGQRMVLQPGGYDTTFGFQVRVVVPTALPNYVNRDMVTFLVKLNIWLTDAGNNKIRLIASRQVTISRTNSIIYSGTIQAGFSLENTSGVAHEISVDVIDNSSAVYTDPSTQEQEVYKSSCSAFVKQNSLAYTASSESLEIGYSGLKVLAQNLWFYFNTKDAEDKHLRMRGNAALLSKNANTSVDLNDVSLTASRVTLQGVIVNLVNKTQNYTIGASDKGIAGIKVVNAAVNVVITLPDLNATDAVGNYYNDNRQLTICATGRNVTVYPSAGQSVRNATYISISANCGYTLIGDRASGNWLFVGA